MVAGAGFEPATSGVAGAVHPDGAESVRRIPEGRRRAVKSTRRRGSGSIASSVLPQAGPSGLSWAAPRRKCAARAGNWWRDLRNSGAKRPRNLARSGGCGIGGAFQDRFDGSAGADVAGQPLAAAAGQHAEKDLSRSARRRPRSSLRAPCPDADPPSEACPPVPRRTRTRSRSAYSPEPVTAVQPLESSVPGERDNRRGRGRSVVHHALLTQRLRDDRVVVRLPVEFLGWARPPMRSRRRSQTGCDHVPGVSRLTNPRPFRNS